MAQYRILIVDDEDEILDVLEDIFSPSYYISRATSIQEAISIFSKDMVDLVISDVMMPDMDGLTFCRLLKSTLEYSHIPIVLLTAKHTLESKIEGLEVGADAYIEKPFSVQYLIAQVNSLISNRNLVKRSFIQNPLVHIKSLTITKTDSLLLQQIDAMIQANITDPHLNVDFIARKLNISRMTLYRKIVAATELTPSELINVTRLKKAVLLMCENKYKLFEVALMVGYSDHSSFTRSFQSQYGLSPRDYVKTLRLEH